jgi:hypothetical protein
VPMVPPIGMGHPTVVHLVVRSSPVNMSERLALWTAADVLVSAVRRPPACKRSFACCPPSPRCPAPRRSRPGRPRAPLPKRSAWPPRAARAPQGHAACHLDALGTESPSRRALLAFEPPRLGVGGGGATGLFLATC